MTGHRRKEISLDSIKGSIPISSLTGMIKEVAELLNHKWPEIQKIVMKRGSDYSAYWYDKGTSVIRLTEFKQKNGMLKLRYDKLFIKNKDWRKT